MVHHTVRLMLYNTCYCFMRSGSYRGSDMQAEAEGVTAQLQLSTVLYCWRQLSSDEWAMIMHRAHESIAAIAVLFEDQVMTGSEEMMVEKLRSRAHCFCPVWSCVAHCRDDTLGAKTATPFYAG